MPSDPSGRGLLPAVRSAGDDGPQLRPGEVVELAQPEIGVTLDDGRTEEYGTLFITNRRLIWFSSEEESKGYSVDFLSLSLHAISRDPEAFPKPCIYTQIDTGDSDDDDDEETVDDNQHERMDGVVAENNLSVISEMRLIPQDPSSLDQIFKVLCDCAALNPDPEGEREGEGEWIYNEDEVGEANAIGARASGDDVVAHLDQLLTMDEERFEDADENNDIQEYNNGSTRL